MITLQVTKEFADKYRGYRDDNCLLDIPEIDGSYYVGLSAKEQFPKLDWSEAIEVEFIPKPPKED